MKINEVVEGQIWNGVKQAAGGLGSVVKGAGNVLGGIATGGVRMLDKAAGGTGRVGTSNQIAQYDLKQADKKFKQQQQIMGQLGDKAAQEFTIQLRNRGIDISKANSFNPQEIQAEMKFFAQEYFGSDTDKVVSAYVKHKIDDEPIPTTINPTTINSYFNEVNKFRTEATANRYKAATHVALMRQMQQDKEAQADIVNRADQQVQVDQLVAQIKSDESRLNQILKTGQDASAIAQKVAGNKKLLQQLMGQVPDTPATPTATQDIGPLGGTGVSVVQSSPITLRYKKQDFVLDNNGNWYNVMSGKAANPALAQFLQAQADKL